MKTNGKLLNEKQYLKSAKYIAKSRSEMRKDASVNFDTNILSSDSNSSFWKLMKKASLYKAKVELH